MDITIINNTQIILIKDDITKANVDVIVNAANKKLIGGQGVDGAIHQKGGINIIKECRQIRYCPTGKAVITNAGLLQAKKIIHTVGPIYSYNQIIASTLLASCYYNSLKLASYYNLRTIAFPSISTGFYGYPLYSAAYTALKTIQIALIKLRNSFQKIYFFLFEKKNYNAYKKILAILFKNFN